jgi:hypothetical protein
VGSAQQWSHSLDEGRADSFGAQKTYNSDDPIASMTGRSVLRDAEHVAVGILEPSNLRRTIGRTPDSELILFEEGVLLELRTSFHEVRSGNDNVRDTPAEHRMFRRSMARNDGDAEHDAIGVENNCIVVLADELEAEPLAVNVFARATSLVRTKATRSYDPSITTLSPVQDARHAAGNLRLLCLRSSSTWAGGVRSPA